MNTATNIAAMQTSGVSSTPQSPLSGGSPQDLLGFLEAFFQQMQAPVQVPGAAQNAPQGLDMLAEKIADVFKKDGITADQIQNMSPQDLAAQVTQLLQQQNIQVPPALQNMSANDLSVKLASLIQKNVSSNTPAIRPSLTRDLVSPSANIHNTQTKDDIAKKITDMLQQQQQIGVTTLTPVQFHQLEADFSQLQTAPGTISANTMDQLTGDLKTFLANQGVSQDRIAGFTADLVRSLEQSQPAVTTQTAVQPEAQLQPQQSGADMDTNASLYAAQQSSIPTQQQPAETAENVTTAKFVSQANKTLSPGKDDVPPLGTDASHSHPISLAQPSAPPSMPQTANVTAKISGFSVSPALINDLAGGSSDGAGFNGDFGGGFGQNGNAQQSQDLGSTNYLQPLTADMLQNQNFINYMSSAPATQPSPTTQLVNIQIQNNINAGINTMTLQLEPADLGKMDVKLKFAKDGTVKAHMTVDKPETLALLQKDASHLQRALQQSGLTTDENSLSFDLRQQGQHQHTDNFNGHGGGSSGDVDTHMDGNVANALQAQLAIQSSGYITQSGVNIMV